MESGCLRGKEQDPLHQPECDERHPALQLPIKFTLGWLDRVDKMIRQHLTGQGMLMKRGMATSRLYMKPDYMGVWLKSCVAVYLLEVVRILLQYKWGPSSVRNGSGGWRSLRREM